MASFRRLSCALIPLSALLVSAAKADDSIRSITEELVLGVLSVDDPGGGSLADDRLRDLAEERARALVDNARSQTDAVLGVAIPDSIASLIDTPLLEYIEEYSELEGLLTTTLLEYDDLSRAYQIALQPADASDTILLHFDRPPPALPLGRLVRVRGLLLPRVDDETGGSVRHMVLRSDDDALEVLPGADVITAPPPVGGQRTGVFVVNFSGEPAFLEDSTYDKERRQLSDLVRRHSMGAAWLSVERVDHVELATAHTCDARSIRQHFVQALAQSDRDLAEYDRVFAILPTLQCGWRTQTTFPGSPTVVFVGGKPNTKLLLRALLHSFGMPGSHAHNCDFDTIHSECQEGTDPEPEYLRGTNAISISPFHKERAGWMSADQTNGIGTVRGDGSYRIFASDYINRNRWMALKFERPTPLLQEKTTYYIEYRTRRVAHGERLDPEVVIYIVSGSLITDVVNLTSADPVSVPDGIAASVGRFVDHGAGLEIDVVNAYPWAVDLEISFDPASCVAAAPDVKIAPSETPYLSADSTMRLSVAITSRDSEHCGPTGPNLSLQVPNGWRVQHGPETPILQPGETVQMEVSVTIPPGEGPGFRDLEWIVQGDALIEAHRSTMLFVLPRSGGTDESDKIPTPTRTINVSSGSQLSAALSNAQPGDHIVLHNGSYSGFTVSRSGTSARPIVLRSANLHGAKVGNMTIEGDYVWVIGIHAPGFNYIDGKYVRFSRNYLPSGMVKISTAATGAEIDHNEFDGGGGNHSLDPRSSCENIDNFHIHHNYFHDNTDTTVDAAIVMNLGNSCDSDSLVEYNLISNWRGNHGIYDKGGRTTFRFNTVINAQGVSNRGFSRVTPNNSVVGSTRNEWIANWIEGDSMLIHGADNRIIGNHIERGTIHLGCGNWKPGEAPDDTSKHLGFVAATNNLVAGNTGALTVGVKHDTICAGTAGFPKKDIYPAAGNKIQAHQGTIDYGRHTGTQVSQTSSVSIPKAFKLTPSQVGPNAPTAPEI